MFHRAKHSHLNFLWFLSAGLLLILSAEHPANATPTNVTFFQSAQTIEAYDFAEIGLAVSSPDATNPFTDVTVEGQFGKAGSSQQINVTGFCDMADGSVYRIRFMPSSPGDYSYSVVFRQDKFERTHTGTFRATDGHRRGPIRVDPQYPWHFIWESTGEHYFFNGTTAYWLVGWREDRMIDYSIERLHKMKINRMRVLLAGAANMMWGEAVMTGENFTMFLRPWIAQAPENFDTPGIDFTRFNVPYWQKWERMLRFARDRDMIISAVLDIPTQNAHAAAGSEDERRYIRYAIARLGAFSNYTYDLGDDLDSFRDEKWAHETGTLIESWDPYHHLATSHPVHREHQDRAAAWMGFTSIQNWTREQHALMLQERQIQMRTGRIIPQTNEEYGYEDHYPHWAAPPPAASAEVFRQLVWQIAMAGAYSTAGESARRGTNIWPDTGGGWINGRGDDTMIMFKGFEHMVDFFTSFEWWKTEPHDELVNNGAYCLAKPGDIYAVYLPIRPMCGSPENFDYEEACRNITVRLEPGSYDAKWFSAATGEIVPLPAVQGPVWTIPKPPGWLDWAVLLTKAKK
jgi:hypothetical protein